MSTRRIVVPTIGGTGTDDPLRVSLPTYTVIRYSADRQLALVELPDDVLPPSIDTGSRLAAIDTDSAPDVRVMRTIERLRWYAHLDDTYKEHAGRFRPIG